MTATIEAKQHPILFSTPMVEAILEGRKTMTRRVVKYLKTEPNAYNEGRINYVYERGEQYHGGTNCEPSDLNDDFLGIISYCPYGKVGDILWVRESWWKGETWLESDEVNTRKESILYRADTTDARPCDVSDAWCINEYGYDKRDWPSWKPSIHMPKEACRLFLRITNIRVERLQDISEEDAKAEGVEELGIYSFPIYKNYLPGAPSDGYQYSPSSFRSLWKSINGEESWNSNPFVWVIEFERIEKPL